MNNPTPITAIGSLGHEFMLNWDDSFYVIDSDAIRGF